MAARRKPGTARGPAVAGSWNPGADAFKSSLRRSGGRFGDWGVPNDPQRPTGPQTLILDDFPSVAEVKLLGPNSGSSNRYALGRARKAVQARVFVATLRQGIRPVPPPVHVTLRYVMPDDIHRDADNFAVIAKPVIDGLVKSQILAGDNAARLTQRVEFVKERGRRALEVILEPHEEVVP